MAIDILFLFVVIFALIKGVRNGLIVGLFSLVSFIIGIAAAMKLSATVAEWLGTKTDISGKWLPFLSFLLVFVGVTLLINIGARMLRKVVELSMLGLFDKIGGVLLYLFIYTMILSIILFYADKIGIIGQEGISESRTYRFIQPVGPAVIGFMGKLLPFFQDMFVELEQFFETVDRRIEPTSE